MKLKNIIINSVNDKKGKESSTRITSYVILLLIIIFSLSFIVMEILNNKISNEIIIIFMSLLSHQLILLGLNKKYEKNGL